MRVGPTVLAMLLAGCSARVANEDPPRADAAIDSGPALDASSGCSPERDAIAKLISDRACTAVVRLSYGTLAPLGWSMTCGGPLSMNEVIARDAFAPWTAPSTTLSDYELIAHPPYLGPWVFHHAPSDFGGIGVVSSDTGKIAFAGGIVWSGHGAITFPTTWRAPSELGTHCPSLMPSEDRVLGFLGAAEMRDDRVAAARVVFGTALPAAISAGRGVMTTFVIGYPRTVGLFAPEAAEWIVVLEGPLLR